MSKSFRVLYLIMLTLSVGLIALGGATRAVHAGLSCPDWPLCFWQVVPDVHYEVYYEFLHRVLAGVVGLLVLGIQGYILFTPSASNRARWVAGASIVVLLTQVVLGALTVLKLLQAKVVTLHLAFGVLLFALLLWNYWILTRPKALALRVPRIWLLALPTLVYGQVILGGLVSTNYAGLACPDFPTCQGLWWPALQGHVALHWIHRLGAYALVVVLIGHYLWVRAQRGDLSIPRWILGVLTVQILLGIANVVYQIPPIVTVLHLVGGATLLGLTLRQVAGFR